MRIRYPAAAALALLAGGAALADPFSAAITHDAITRNPPVAEPDTPDTSDLQIGVSVICNTGAQAENFVKLRSRGTKIMAAVNDVNEEANDPKACGVAAIAYRRDKTMATRSLNGKLVDIVRISVLAGYNGRGWTRVRQNTQYAIVQGKGVAI